MTSKEHDDRTEQAILDALKSVERIEQESKESVDDDLDPDSIEVLHAPDTPPSGDGNSGPGGDAVAEDPRRAGGRGQSSGPDDEEEEILIEDDDPRPPKKSGSDPMLAAMIAAKNELAEVLDQTQKEAKSMRERLMRVSADFENFKKRQAREKEQAIQFANERLLKELLPVLDNMDRAVDSAREQTEGMSEAGKNVVEGVTMVLKQFTDTLSKFGIKAFSAAGNPFDPNLHEAMSQREDTSVPDGTVVEEYQRGFTLHDRLVRPAMVIVSTGGPKRGSEAGSPDENDATRDEDGSGET